MIWKDEHQDIEENKLWKMVEKVVEIIWIEERCLQRKFSFIKHNICRKVYSTSWTEAFISFTDITKSYKHIFVRMDLKLAGLIRYKESMWIRRL